MGQSDNNEDSTYSRHQDLCQKLNMDAISASDAWKSYQSIRQNYILEGDQLQWIGCALFVACRKVTTPTVGKSGTNVEGNCVSLTRLLKLCNLPLIEFFTKSRFWADMAHMPQEFRTKIDKIERNFAVSMVIFQKYQPMFVDIFKSPHEDAGKPVRSRRHRATPCTSTRLFEFCWTLFICIKSAIPDIADDLVNSYHLLLVCCDLMYSNVLLSNRKDLLNPKFAGLPANFHSDDYTPPDSANCILDILCDHHEGICVDARSIKEYSLREHLNRLFSDRDLRGDSSNFSGILDPMNFDGNLKAISKLYEQYVLNSGDFDERIFLAGTKRVVQMLQSAFETKKKLINDRLTNHSERGADATENIGLPSMVNVSEILDQLRNDKYKGNLAPPTPLTGRRYLSSKENCNIAPVSDATQNVIQLQNLIGCQAQPSDGLQTLLNGVTDKIRNQFETTVKECGDLFYAKYTHNVDDADASKLDFGKKRLLMGQSLFYKLLEMILNDEKRKNPNIDFSDLLANNIFIPCLFACCLEIVMFSYQNEDKQFPWILKALNLEAYNFYKVIEPIVRVAYEKMTRNTVKYLNTVEESILESMAWKRDSPLWSAIENMNESVPSYEEVSLPGTLDAMDRNTPGKPQLRKLALDRGAHHDVQQSPISSVSERFQSPINTQGTAKKRLFTDAKLSTGASQSVLKVTSGSQSLLSRQANSQSDANRKDSPTTSSVQMTTSTPMSTSNSVVPKPRRTGSVPLFFRKFYNLAVYRMRDLCCSLKINDLEINDLEKKIWTTFEYTIKEQTSLMKDRHLDQLLMCAIYVVCKIAKIENNSFAEIMQHYKRQPQADSQIYRSVLIRRIENSEERQNERNDNDSDSRATVERENVPMTPNNMAGTSHSFDSEVRGDLIKFYNLIYVPAVKDCTNRLVTRGTAMSLTLSPLPKGKSSTSSPVRRVTNCVMTRTLDSGAIIASPAPKLVYCFSRSPAKDLEEINKMMTKVDARKSVNKRLLADDNDVEMSDASQSPNKKTAAFVARKLENIIGDRRTQSQ